MSGIRPNDYLEWEYLRVEPISTPGLYIHDDGDGLEIVTRHGEPDFEKYKIDSWDQDGIAAVMALANHCLDNDDLRKITRAMVGGLVETIDEALANGNSSETRCIVLARQAVAALNALLPPQP